MRILIVEDNPHRINQFKEWKPKDINLVFVTSAGPALGLIQRDKGYIYAGVMLDHDLVEQHVSESESNLSGSQVTNLIIECFSYETYVLIHSMNASKGFSMQSKLENADFNVIKIKFFLDTLRIAYRHC